MSAPIKLEDIPALVGTSFHGAPFTVTRSERDAFEGLTGVTRAYPADDAPEFPTDIVEGFHSLALLDAVAVLARPFDPAATYGYNYGLDRVRWTAPIRIGDTVRSEFLIAEATERDGGWLVRRHVTLTVEGAQRPALVADWLVLILPRADAPPNG